jgi:hypothetical protein
MSIKFTAPSGSANIASLSFNIVPEAGAFWLGSVIWGVVGLTYGGRSLWRKSQASQELSV